MHASIFNCVNVCHQDNGRIRVAWAFYLRTYFRAYNILPNLFFSDDDRESDRKPSKIKIDDDMGCVDLNRF